MTSLNDIAIRATNAADWPAIRPLLEASALPLDGANENLADFFVAEQDGAVVGCAGLERHGDVALLRSCAVDARHREHGIASALTKRAIEYARESRIRELVLLTTTAEKFFSRFGFMHVTREDVNEALKLSAEFQGACPASASVMRLIFPSA